MIKKIIYILLFVFVFSTMTAFADEVPTDPYTGEPLDWDINGVSYEEGAGDDNNLSETVDTDDLYYSEEEKESIAQMFETAPAETVSSVKGSLIIRFSQPDDWPEYPIEIRMYDENMNLHAFYLYKRNNYETQENLPTGHYQVYIAKVQNDTKNTYPLEWDISEIDITETGVSTLNIVTKREENVIGTTESIELETTNTENNSIPEIDDNNTNNNTLVGVLILIGIIALISIIIYFIYKYFLKENIED